MEAGELQEIAIAEIERLRRALNEIDDMARTIHPNESPIGVLNRIRERIRYLEVEV